MRNVRFFIPILILFSFLLLFAAKGEIFQVDKSKCIGCKLCVPVCPTKAISMKDGKAVIDPEKCIGCELCVKKCPVNAIKKAPEKKPEIKKPKAEKKKPEIKKPAPKTVFSIIPKECTGCKECVPVCPTKAISIVSGKAVIDPEKCINCGLCARACAFGAPVKKEVK